MGRIILGVVAVVLIAAGAWIAFFLRDAGVFDTVAATSPGECRAVEGVVGVEDITIDPETGLAFLSGYDRVGEVLGKPLGGAVWTYDLATAGAAPVDAIAGSRGAAFAPHGIALHRGADGRRTLFVINHAGGEQAIEIFDVDGATLKHRRTVKGPELVSPNDIVGVGADAFYVTNDHANVGGWKQAAEDYMRLRLTKVYYFDGEKFAEVVSGLGGSNGINVSADGRSLYISAASERRVHVFDRDIASGALTRRAIVAVPGFADNIELLPDGDLLLGLHTKILALIAHFRDPAKPSPSHVMRLRADGGSFTPETIYYEEGKALSGASVGAAWKDRLLIGAIVEPKILDCAWSPGT
jgi:arylesterase/paraoxonase